VTDSLQTARERLREGRTGLAIGLLRDLLAAGPADLEAQELLAEALERSGDVAGAEMKLREVIAEDPSRSKSAAQLCRILVGSRRAGEALSLIAPAAEGTTDPALLTAYGAALKSEGRFEDAVPYYQRAVERADGEAVADHNLAGALGDAHRFDESLAMAEQALGKGLDAPETWLVKARALAGLGRYDEAETAYAEAIRRRPNFADAHADLAQLVWMRTGDSTAALAALEKAQPVSGLDLPLLLVKARLLEYAEGEAAAYAAIADLAIMARQHAPLQLTASRLAKSLDPDRAHQHALDAYDADPSAEAAAVLCQAKLAAGYPEEAARIAQDLERAWPNDQQATALLATAWRILSDPRYHELYDYDRLVRRYTVETPSGWSDRAEWLGELASALRDLHRLRTHPVGQSLRDGTQTSQALTQSKDKAVQAFFAAIDAPIRDYMAMLAKSDDRLGTRATGRYRFAGAWSVQLRPGGRHVNHIHQLGWISSAFHVETPPAIDTDRQGWLSFGEPGLPTRPPLPAEHFEKPKAGDLVLFPSYMWHGTLPFEGDRPRLTVAFDAVPA
jgi:tetratricopeptide (TPR) repeat protein